MSLIWVICGAGRGVGKTTLAKKLCEVLPNSVYVKCGQSEIKNEKDKNYFRLITELEFFIEKNRQSKQHIVVESNRFVYTGRGDIVIFVDGNVSGMPVRDDWGKLKSLADICIEDQKNISDWKAVLCRKLKASQYCDAICKIFEERKNDSA